MAASQAGGSITLQNSRRENGLQKIAQNLGSWQQSLLMHFMLAPIELTDATEGGHFTRQSLAPAVFLGCHQDGPIVALEKAFLNTTRHPAVFCNVAEEEPARL